MRFPGAALRAKGPRPPHEWGARMQDDHHPTHLGWKRLPSRDADFWCWCRSPRQTGSSQSPFRWAQSGLPPGDPAEPQGDSMYQPQWGPAVPPLPHLPLTFLSGSPDPSPESRAPSPWGARLASKEPRGQHPVGVRDRATQEPCAPAACPR